MGRGPAGGIDLRAVLPVAGAIGVFGIVFGTAARPVLGGPLTVATSVLVFSGAAQFSMVGLLGAGASVWPVLGAVAFLNLRHLPLGAVVRPRLEAGRAGRCLLAWFLIDEAVGFALSAGEQAGRVLAAVGMIYYAAWVIGTVAGVAGGAAAGLEELAGAVFPVLFIGLASLMARGGDLVARTLAAAALTVALLLTWPAMGGLAPVLAAGAVAVPRGRR